MRFLSLDGPNRGYKITVGESVSIVELLRWLQTEDITDSKIICKDSLVSDIEGNFPINSKFAEVIEQNNLEIYSTHSGNIPISIIQDEVIYFSIRMGSVERFEKLPEDAATTLEDEFDRLLVSAEEVVLDIPPWDELLEKLENVVDKSTRKEFERLIQAAQVENLGSLDETSVALIAASQSGVLMYDLSKWGEEIGLASKATFSRRKTSLEEEGVIDTESVPVDVGRPRQRLVLADDISGINIDIGIEDKELGISTADTSEDEDSGQQGSAATSEVEPKQTEEDSEADGEILTTIEKEIQDAIRSN